MSYTPDEFATRLMQYRRVRQQWSYFCRPSLSVCGTTSAASILCENCRAMLRRAFDLGITHFDLANNYGPPPGSAEENFGRS